jgi:DNA primase
VALQDYQSAKEQIRQAIDIVDLVGGYIALQRQGRGYVGLCPWHDDARPSLQVNPDRQSFKCWVCDIGGDLFSFLMKMESVEFREALQILAERAGVSLQATGDRGKDDSPFAQRHLLRAMAWAQQQYHRCLVEDPAAEPARSYLAERGIESASVERFHIGFAPLEWDWLLKRAASDGISPDVLERVDCVVRKDRGGFYDRFRGRLMFSIRDVRGRPIAFGGRALPQLARPDDAKYINSRETPLFNKSGQLYGLDVARDAIAREKSVVIMEGYTDVVMAHQHGVDHAVAVLGTALGEKHIPLLRRFTDSITLVLDGDAAGKSRTLDILDKLLALFVAYEVELKILTLPEGCDPCDVIASQGRDAFFRLLAQANDALTHKIEAVTNGLAPASDPHRASLAVESILATLARALPQGAAPSSAAYVREHQTLVRIARLFGLAEAALRTRLAALRQNLPIARGRRDDNPNVPSQPTSVTPYRVELTAWEREFLQLLMYSPEAMTQLLQVVGEADFPTRPGQELYRAMLQQIEDGSLPSFESMMLLTDDPDLKNHLVNLDEDAQRKSDSDLQLRIDGMIASLRERRLEPRYRSMMAELQTRQLDVQHEDQTLRNLFDELKSRQAPASPTDG